MLVAASVRFSVYVLEEALREKVLKAREQDWR